jgi:ornithine cyclodeaminase/alanine dehydrogenase-like protein (mu-crystallin family)
MPLRVIDREELRAALTMRDAIEALRIGFRDGDPSHTSPRAHLETPSGSLLMMPAFGAAGVGVKLVTVTPANPAAGRPPSYSSSVLFDPNDQHAVVVLDGAALTALRTAAVSGLAASLLANPDAGRLVVFGAGVHARAHVEAMRAVRPIVDVAVVSRGPAAADAFVEDLRRDGVDARLGEPHDVGGADLVCTCTTSPVPVFDGHALAPGAHVTAVGAYTLATRELDGETMRRGRLVVETREAALAEAGDIALAIGEGAIDASTILADLSEVVRGGSVRTDPADVTIFESVGLAFEDLVVASAIARAVALGPHAIE